jgi:hypothetical protein
MARILIASPSEGSKDNLPWEVESADPKCDSVFLGPFLCTSSLEKSSCSEHLHNSLPNFLHGI